MLTAQRPGRGAPVGAQHDGRIIVGRLQGQHIAGHLAQAPFQQPRQAAPLFGRLQVGLQRVQVARQRLFALGLQQHVLVGGNRAVGRQAQRFGQFGGEAGRLVAAIAVVDVFVREQGGVEPHRLAVDAPEDIQRPARQRLARIPFALAVVQHAARREVVFQPVHQVAGQLALLVAVGQGVPLRAVHVVDRHEGRLAALRQAHVLALQVGVDLLAQLVDLLPVRFRIRFRHARVFVDAGDRHLMVERDFGLVGIAADRRGRRWHRGAGERNVSLAGQHAGGRVQPDPAGAGDIHLGPRMQVGKIFGRAAGAVQRLLVGAQLNQVAGHETRRQPQFAQDLHQQPAGVAAGARALLQRVFRRLHARLHAQQVGNIELQSLVDGDQEVIGQHRLRQQGGACFGNPCGLQRPRRLRDQVGAQFRRQLLRVGERKFFGVFFNEEIEGVDDRHVGHQVDREVEHVGFFLEHETADVIAVRVLLPVDEMVLRLHRQRVRQDRCARMGGRAQADFVWRQIDQTVVAVTGLVVQRDTDSHAECLFDVGAAGAGAISLSKQDSYLIFQRNTPHTAGTFLDKFLDNSVGAKMLCPFDTLATHHADLMHSARRTMTVRFTPILKAIRHVAAYCLQAGVHPRQ